MNAWYIIVQNAWCSSVRLANGRAYQVCLTIQDEPSKSEPKAVTKLSWLSTLISSSVNFSDILPVPHLRKFTTQVIRLHLNIQKISFRRFVQHFKLRSGEET